MNLTELRKKLKQSGYWGSTSSRAGRGQTVRDFLNYLMGLAGTLGPHAMRKIESIGGCGQSAKRWDDENDGSEGERHSIYLRLFCGKDFCPRCGKKDSDAHQRRVMRNWDRLMWADAIGYVVLTIPKELRHHFRDRTVENVQRRRWIEEAGNKRQVTVRVKRVRGQRLLSELQRIAAETIQEVFGVLGVCVSPHLFGDLSDEFAPHVNCLFPIPLGEGVFHKDGRVSKETLAKLRRTWREKVESLLGESFPIKSESDEFSQAYGSEYKENAYFSSSRDYVHWKKAANSAATSRRCPPSRDRVSAGMMVHWIKYVFRPVVGFERLRRLDDDLICFLLELERMPFARWYGELSNGKYREFLRSIGKSPSEDLSSDNYCKFLELIGEESEEIPEEKKRVLGFFQGEEIDGKLERRCPLCGRRLVDRGIERTPAERFEDGTLTRLAAGLYYVIDTRAG